MKETTNFNVLEMSTSLKNSKRIVATVIFVGAKIAQYYYGVNFSEEQVGDLANSINTILTQSSMLIDFGYATYISFTKVSDKIREKEGKPELKFWQIPQLIVDISTVVYKFFTKKSDIETK